MGTIIICLLVLAVALLLYVIAQGNKEKNIILQKEDPLGGLPDIIGRPKGISNHSLPSTAVQDKRENVVDANVSFETRNEEIPRVSENPKDEPEEANVLPDWMEEEEEMVRYAVYGTDEGFATGVTFDELAIAQEMLARQSLNPSEEKTSAGIASKIDGTELLELLESKIGDASKKIAILLDRGGTVTDGGSSLTLRDDPESNFNIGNYV